MRLVMKNRGIKDVQSESRFLDLIRSKGYESVEKFSEDCEITPQSIFVHIRGQYKPSLKRMFKYAEVLTLPIDDIIELFYEEELHKNRKVAV